MAENGAAGLLIRDGRIAKGWSQEDLAERMGDSSSTVSNWETGRVRPSIEQGNRLVRALNLSAEAFWQAMGVELTPPRATRLPRNLVSALLVLSAEDLDALTVLVERAAAGARRDRESGP